jgi:glycosyltransferase involved in cell wall biosynthesis
VVRTTSRWIAAAAVLSPSLMHVYRGLVPPDRLRAVAAGIPDPLAMVRANGSPSDGPGRVVVGFLGTLYRPKGFLDLIEAAALLDRDEPGRYIFRFAGEWNSDAERREATAMVPERRLADVVEFRGTVQGAEKAEFLRALDILAFPGYQPEGLPLVVLEAMGAGRPVIATPMGAIPDVVVPGETGELVPPRDPAAMAAAIRRLADDPAARARYGAAGRERYLAEYTEDKCVERMIELLRFGAEQAA